MKITYDKVANAAYISLKEISPGEVADTICLNDNINIDLDKDEKTFGIEILEASLNLPNSVIKTAEIIY